MRNITTTVTLLLMGMGQALLAQPKSAPKQSPVIIVETTFPGANAAVVADTVAAPIEQQVNGVEGMLHMRSRCTNDGRYVLSVTFRPGSDVNQAQVLVQNRVSLALALLPEEVKRLGITTRKEPGEALFYACLYSSDKKYDPLYLSNYATLKIVDELNRVAGVGDVKTIGLRDYAMRIRLDPQKLEARKLTPGDVVNALKGQNVQVPAGRIGQPPVPNGQMFEYTVKPQGRLTDPEDFAKVIVKATDKGTLVRLGDVAKVELGASASQQLVLLNGKAAVVLAISPAPQALLKNVSAALRKKLEQLRTDAPKGLALELAFDFTIGQTKPHEHCQIDVDLPVSASHERTLKTLEHVQTLLGKVDGVQSTLAMTDDISYRGRLLVSLTSLLNKPAADRVNRTKAMRAELAKVTEAVVRLRGPALPGMAPPSYPIDLAIHGEDLARVRKLADAVAERLCKNDKLIDVWVNQDSMLQPVLNVEIDRKAAQERGVSLTDVFDVLQAHAGSIYVNDFNRFGRTWQVTLIAGPKQKERWRIDDLKQLKVRNKKGELEPLSGFVKIREVAGPVAVERLNMQPMVSITANLGYPTTLAQARTLCESAVNEARKELHLPATYRLTRLRDMPAAK
jgi:multidrug efflux pump subunit AcrB